MPRRGKGEKGEREKKVWGVVGGGGGERGAGGGGGWERGAGGKAQGGGDTLLQPVPVEREPSGRDQKASEARLIR